MPEEMISIVIPILAILCGTIIYLTWIRNQKKGLSSDQKKMLEEMRQAHEENQRLSKRVKNLEYIVTSLDKDILKLYQPELSNDELINQIAAMKEEIKQLKG